MSESLRLGQVKLRKTTPRKRFRKSAPEIYSLFLARLPILCLLCLVPLQARAERVKVALLDNEPVYHWTHFPSVVSDDVDRALVLRAFHRQGLHIPDHIVDEAVRQKINHDFGGDRAKLMEALKSHGETMATCRQFLTEEIILRAMVIRETREPKDGHPPPTVAEWLTSLRKGIHVEMINQGKHSEVR